MFADPFREHPNVVGVAQLVEHRIVVPVVAGSSPVAHPTLQGGSVFPSKSQTRPTVSRQIRNLICRLTATTCARSSAG
jgi:hypothetical protein